MKFVHMADMHFDSPFVNLSDRDIMGDLRRIEQRKVFKKIIEYIKEENIDYLFIAGDLYEHNYIKKSTIEYINGSFKEIPNTKIFIAPGNHDPKIKNSYYNKYDWNENVIIFEGKIEKIELPQVDIYGYGFDDFYCDNAEIENLQIENKEKLNILLIHGTLNGTTSIDKQYNSMNKKMLEEKGFDYIALGHIHKKDYNTYTNQNIVYPGSTISLGFDELGEHGIISGNLNKNELKIEFIPMDNEEFIEKKIDVTEIFSKEDLIEKLNTLYINDNQFVKIILTGNRNFEIDIYELIKFIDNNRIIKIKNQTKIGMDLKKLANEITLKGLFVKEMLEKLENADISENEKTIIEKSIEIGLDALE